MPNKIKVLPENLANKIAAGEVIERPASLVKELIENSIDAQATKISVEVSAGGKQLICVVDDGVGMSYDDAIVAFERHSTSKINQASDLFSISTLGFRGEALPSIASVSRATLETRQAEDLAGTRVTIEGGILKNVVQIGRDIGTTVSVKNLFFNTPARRKFLKSVDTEMRQITQTVTLLALGYPQITFSLTHNERELFKLSRQTDRGLRLQEVFGADLMKQIVPFVVEKKGIMVEGFVGQPSIARNFRTNQYFFVNNRAISNRTLSHAVYSGYGNLLARDLYPIFVIFLTLDPKLVDVNVHPTKKEVRFSDDRVVYDLVYQAVRDSFRIEESIPQFAGSFGQKVDTAIQDTAESQVSLKRNDVPGTESGTRGEGDDAKRLFDSTRQTSLPMETLKSIGLHREKEEGRLIQGSGIIGGEQATPPSQSYTESISLWQLHGRYILAHIKDGLVIIDQHVAHERILYEEAMKSFSNQPGVAQQLLFPITIELTWAEMQAAEEVMSLLELMGFGLKKFGEKALMIEAVPSDLRENDIPAILTRIIDEMAELGKSSFAIKEKLAVSYACHAAIKAGQPLSQVEMQALIDRLFATEQPFVCPHGRPIVVKVSLEELDRRFGR